MRMQRDLSRKLARSYRVATLTTTLALSLLIATQPLTAQAAPDPDTIGLQSEEQTSRIPPKAIQCFYQAGTYGAITVTTSGSGCGNILTFGGITGIWLGDGNASESCTFNISPAVIGATGSVAFTAHSCVSGGCEKVRFRLNGVDYNVQAADLDDTTPTGGNDPVVILPSGEVEGNNVGGADGRATVTFNNAPGSVTSIEIDHIVTSGSPAGTIYQICVDDVPVELMRFTID